jgi:hypothetical protein
LVHEKQSKDESREEAAGLCFTCSTRLRSSRAEGPYGKSKAWIGSGGLAERTTFCCSVKITEDVRKFAAERGISEEAVLEISLQEKAKEFKESGAEVYAKA